MRSNFEYELRVEHFLTENRRTFISPQYELLNEGNSVAGYCPDFVAITPADKDIFVVEVSVGGALADLELKIKNRDQNLIRLREQLIKDRVITDDWRRIAVLVFVKDDQVDSFRKNIAPDNGEVYVWPVEWASHHWMWGTTAERACIDFRQPQRLKTLLAKS